MMEFMPCALAPAYGVTSMSFRPGCHRPFHRSACLRSLLLLSQDCVLSLFGSVSFASAIPDLVLQHVLTSTVVTLRPFTPCFNCWCLQRQSIVTPRCRWWFRGTHPSWCFVEGGGLEPPAIHLCLPYFTCRLLMRPSSIISCISCSG